MTVLGTFCLLKSREPRIVISIASLLKIRETVIIYQDKFGVDLMLLLSTTGIISLIS